MKVIVFTSIYPNRAMPVYGAFSKERIRHLRGRCAIKVIAPIRYDLLRKTHKNVPQIENDDGITVFHPCFFNIPKWMKWTDGFLFMLSILPTVIKIKKAFSPDLIDAHWGYPDGLAAFLIGKLLKLPVVVTLLGSDINVFMREILRGGLMRWYLIRIHRIVVVSQALKYSLKNYGIPEEKIVVIETGVDTGKFLLQDQIEARKILGLALGGKIILAVGNLVSIKGPDILLEAFAKLANRSVFLIFVGDGPLRGYLEKKVATLSPTVLNRIRFVGQQAHEKISLWLSACNMLVLASRNEGLPNVLLEAMACGRPVVASHVGGVGEIVVSNEVGLMVPPEDPDALSRALEKALACDWDSKTIRRHVERFSWEYTTERYLVVWQEVLTSYGAHQEQSENN